MSAFAQYGKAQPPQPTYYSCDDGVDPMMMMLVLTMMQMMDKFSTTKSTTTITSNADPDTIGEVQMVPGAVVGPTFSCILGVQFTMLMDGDR